MAYKNMGRLFNQNILKSLEEEAKKLGAEMFTVEK